MDRPGLLPREVEPLEQPEHPALAVADPEAALDQGAQVAGAPGDAAVALQLGPLEDQRLEGGLLPLVERARSAGAGPVTQAFHALGVVAVHPVAERLPGHAGEPSCLLAWQAVERVGEREQAGADAPVALAAGEAAQLGRVAVGADRQRCGHGGISRRMPPKRLRRSGDPSPVRPAGIIRRSTPPEAAGRARTLRPTRERSWSGLP